MFTNRTILTLIVCAATLCATAQESRTERLPGSEPTDVRSSETRRTLSSNPTADSVLNIRTTIRTYVDTLRIISMHTDTLRQAAELDPNDRRGHYVELHAGAGLGSVEGLGESKYGFIRRDLQHATASGYEKAGLSGVVQLQYAYFFHPSVGIGIGAWLANYTSHGTLSGEFVYPRTATMLDSDNEPYEHHAAIGAWDERQTVHTVGVPVSLQFQAWGKKRGAAGFFFDLGAAPVYTVKSNYHVLSGNIEHYGRYEQWAMTGKPAPELHDVKEFHSITYNGQQAALDVKRFSATAFVDLGLLIRMSQHTDLLLGIYAHYTFLDIQNASLTDIGWKTDDFPNLDMQPYNGILATNCIKGQLHPAEAGVKLGLHWHTPAKPKQHYTYEQHMDTTVRLAERRDTVIIEKVETLSRTEQVQQQIDKLNRIYFAFDSYALNEESKQFLAAIAQQLNTVPNKIVIGGHASKEGTKRHNEQLALNRALTVRRYLISLGVDAKRMIAKEYGSTVPNAINTHNEMSLDRRVEIILQDE